MLLVVTLFCWFFSGLATSSQPWPLEIERIGHCCSQLRFQNQSSLIEDSQILDKCLTERAENTHTEEIALLTLASEGSGTFSIDNIKYFSPYQFAIMEAYCEQRKYSCQLLASLPKQYSQKYFLDDFRWYKVALLKDSFHSWGRNLRALVWIDSDAIIVNFNLSIEHLLSLYPEANIIASADIKQGLINTGFMIFRNNAWTRPFLENWWIVSNKSIECDQEAFDRLYHQLAMNASATIVSEIKILSTDQLNTHPPAWLHHEKNPILHLMGESALYRAEVFRHGFLSICKARSGGILPPSLDITHQFLLSSARSVYHDETQNMFIRANQSGDIADIEKFSQASHHYVDILQHDLQQLQQSTSSSSLRKNQLSEQRRTHLLSEIVNMRRALFILCLNRIEDIKKTIQRLEQHHKALQQSITSSTEFVTPTVEHLEQLFSYQNQTRLYVQELLAIQKKAAEAGNAFFWSLTSHNLTEKLQISQQILVILNDLVDTVDDHSRWIPQHMKALLYQNLGIMYYEEYQLVSTTTTTATASSLQREQYLRLAAENSQISLQLFDQFFRNSNDSSIRLEYLHSIQLVAAIACLQKDYRQGLLQWQRAILKARENTDGLQLGLHYEKLSIVLYNAAICSAEGEEDLIALQYLQEAEMIVLKALDTKETLFDPKHSNKQREDLLQLLQTIRQYLDTMKKKHQEFQDNQSPPVKNQLDSVVQEQEDQQTPVMKKIHHKDGSISYRPETFPPQQKASVASADKAENEDEYEWEECTDLDDGDCDSFYVQEEFDTISTIPSGLSSPSTTHHASVASPSGTLSPPSSSSSLQDDEAHLYEGLSEEEKLELMAIRKRYARLTTAATTTLNSPQVSTVTPSSREKEEGNSIIANMGHSSSMSESQKIIALMEEKTELIKQLHLLQQENLLLKQKMKQIQRIID